jgi:hypothetical protein
MLTQVIIAIVGLAVFCLVGCAIAPSLKDHEACQPEEEWDFTRSIDDEKPKDWYGKK